MVNVIVMYEPPADPAAFEDQQAMQASLGSAEGQATTADIPRFATGGATFLITEVD